MVSQFLDAGVDIKKEPMEVAPTAHHHMGGVRIDEDGRTTIENLFACGEVCGGVHGGNRLGGNALADTQVFGKRAGFTAALACDISDHDKGRNNQTSGHEEGDSAVDVGQCINC